MAKYDILVETEKFQDALRRYGRFLGGLSEKAVIDATEAFCQSSARCTPVAKKKRSIVPLTPDDYRCFYDRMRRQFPDGPLPKCKVFLHYMFQGKIRNRVKFFLTEKDASRYQRKIYKGVGRAAWYAAIDKMGRSAAKRQTGVTDESKVAAVKLVNVKMVMGFLNKYMEVSYNVASLNKNETDYIKAGGYRAARNRLNAVITQKRKALQNLSTPF